MQFFLTESRRHLADRDKRCERSKRHESIEGKGYSNLKHRYIAESLLENIGKRDENQRGTTVGTHPYGESSREYHHAGKDSNHAIDNGNLHSSTRKVGLTGEIRGISADTSHGNA